MNELELLRIDLNNFIHGHEISKSACKEYWSKDDERALQLLYRIRDVLNRIETRKAEPSNCSEIPNNWIPCSERLPEEYGEYRITWTTSASKKPFIGDAEYEISGEWDSEHDRFKGEWLLADYISTYPDVKVTAWKPMEEPYQSEEE